MESNPNLEEINDREQLSIGSLDEEAKKQIRNPSKFLISEFTEDLINKATDSGDKKNKVLDQVDDSDLRFLMACKNSVMILNNLQSRRMKPEFESYKTLIEINDIIKNILMILVVFVLFFSKPEWCA